MRFVRFHRVAALPAIITGVLVLGAVAQLAQTKRPSGDPNEPVLRVLADQSAAWNRGDIDAFMAGYERTATLRFASGGDVTRGWEPTLERYRKRYPDRAAMGTLAFTDLEVTPLGADAAVVFGRWRLERAKDSPNGLFTLTLRKTDVGWRIIQDHTSSAGP